MFNETDVLKNLKNMFTALSDDVVIGIGDDCAAIKKGDNKLMLLSTDSLMEDVHFSTSYFEPHDIARKSVSVSVSDIASMGGRPMFILSTIGLPKCSKQVVVDGILEGLKTSCEFYGVELIGGNLTNSEKLFLDITVMGEIDQDNVIKRNGSSAGDLIFVTGTLGDSALGLRILKSEQRKPSDLDDFGEIIINRHKNPSARVDIGMKLSDQNLASSMIDISDGLLIDLERITCDQNLGAVINVADLPYSEAYEGLISDFEEDKYRLALTGGEDYELLFTSPSESRDEVVSLGESLGLKVTEIGIVTSGKTIELSGGVDILKYKNKGFVHFS